MQASQVHAMMMEMMLGFKQNQARDLKRDGEAFMASNGSFVRWYEVRVQYGVLNVFSLMLSMDTIIFAPDPDNVVQLRRAETTELVQARMLEPADICLGERVCAWRLARDV